MKTTSYEPDRVVNNDLQLIKGAAYNRKMALANKGCALKNRVRFCAATIAVMAFGTVIAGRAFAVEVPAAPPAAGYAITLTLKDHKFDKSEVEAPAHQKFTITVINQDSTPEEFESHDMHREKIVPANGTITMNLGPLKPGVYKFVGEYHEDIAKGTLTVK